MGQLAAERAKKFLLFLLLLFGGCFFFSVLLLVKLLSLSLAAFSFRFSVFFSEKTITFRIPFEICYKSLRKKRTAFGIESLVGFRFFFSI